MFDISLGNLWERVFLDSARSQSVLKPGDRVVLNVPYNPRLHGEQATVRKIEEWGAHVSVTAAASGTFRALYAEMDLGSRVAAPPSEGYTGDICPTCGGSRMRRCGSCATCEDCGSSTGCV